MGHNERVSSLNWAECEGVDRYNGTLLVSSVEYRDDVVRVMKLLGLKIDGNPLKLIKRQVI